MRRYRYYLKTSNSGTSWLSLTSPTTNRLWSSCFTDPSNGYCTGDNGTIIKTIDAGASWTVQNSGSTHFFGSVKFLDANTGFMVGGNAPTFNSTILKTEDAGITWTVQTSSSTRQKRASFPSFNAGFSCGGGGIILKTTGIAVGISKINNNLNCDLFPNPSNGKFEIIINDKTSKKNNISVFNSSGEIIFKEETDKNNVVVDISNNAKGIYFVEVKNEKGITTEKIVVNK